MPHLNTTSHVSQHSSFKQVERQIDSYFKLTHYIQEIPIKGILDFRTIWMNAEMGWPTQTKQCFKCTKQHVITSEIQIRKAKRSMWNISDRNENKRSLKKGKTHLKSKTTSKIIVLPKFCKFLNLVWFLPSGTFYRLLYLQDKHLEYKICFNILHKTSEAQEIFYPM